MSALRDVRDAGTVAFVGVTERLVMFVSVTRCSRCWYSGFCRRYREVGDVRDAGAVLFVSVTRCSRCCCNAFCQRYRDVRSAGAVAFVSVTRCSGCWYSGFCQR